MCIHYSTLAQNRRVYVILTLEVIKGHWRSISKTAPRDPFVCIHRQIITHIIQTMLILSQMSLRSIDVTKKWQNRVNNVKCNLTWFFAWLIQCDRNDWSIHKTMQLNWLTRFHWLITFTTITLLRRQSPLLVQERVIDIERYISSRQLIWLLPLRLQWASWVAMGYLLYFRF